jgi:uncharacterized protein (TIGR02678 family)
VIGHRTRTRESHRAYVDLLDRAAVSAADDDAAFRRIRAMIEDVRGWYARRTGWPTIVTRDMIRTVKTPSVVHVGQGFEWVSDALDYELFVWILWYGESIASDQFVFSDLVAEVELRATELHGEGHFTWNRLEHRRSLKRAAEALEDLGAIREVDGSVAAYAEARSEDALYEFTDVSRHLHLNAPDDVYDAVVVRQSPDGLREPVDDAADVEQRLYRTLLLSPALHAHHDPDAFALLRSSARRERIAEDLRTHLGWDLEVTPGYACLLRPARDARGRATFPTRSAEAHVVLLLCGYVRRLVAAGELVPDELDAVVVTRAWFESRIVDLQAEFGAQWGRTMSRLSLDALVDGVFSLMRGWGLMEAAGDGDDLRILPLAARWEAVYLDDGGALGGEEDRDVVGDDREGEERSRSGE